MTVKFNGKRQKYSLRCSPEHSHKEWLEKFQQHGFHCHYCEKLLTFSTVTKDHLVPICRKGTDKIDNIVPCCMPCNRMKAWRTAEEFRADFQELSTKVRYFRGRKNPKPGLSFEELTNEPGLLKRVTHEREQVSWWWRNPV